MDRKLIAAAITAAITAAFGAGVAVGQNAPTENKGVTVSGPTFVDLTNEVDTHAGRQLRMRTVSIEPGGVVAMHSHKGRPAVAIAQGGNLTEHLEDGSVHDHAPGEPWTEANGISHWAENRGSAPIKVVACDVFKP